jgi:hypothetical protein
MRKSQNVKNSYAVSEKKTKRDHPGKASKPCPLRPRENAEKIDKFSNSIRNPGPSERSKAVTLK